MEMIPLTAMPYESPAYYRPPPTYLERPSPSGLRDVLELILDRGLVIDIFVRVSLVGIEILTIDARIVVASVDTYLRFARAVNRLDLTQAETSGLPELMGQITEPGARSRANAVLQEARDKLEEIIHGGDQGQQQPAGQGGGERQP
jgi:gas vesicle structural protein